MRGDAVTVRRVRPEPFPVDRWISDRPLDLGIACVTPPNEHDDARTVPEFSA